jgi:nucleoside-diphosphate-sugar epimerase
MRIALAGATGVLGRRVAARLRAAGHELRLLVRRPPARDPDAVVGDLADPASLPRWLEDCDVALHLATALRAGPDGQVDWARNDRVRDEGTAHLVQACTAAGVGRLIVQSVAFVRSPGVDAWCRGDEPLAELPFLRSARVLEQRALGGGLAATVLRGGLFYGPDTALSAAWAAAAHDGCWRVPANAENFVSLVHVDDMADAVAAAAGGAGGAGGLGVLAVTDDAPLRWSDLIRGLAASGGAGICASGGPPTPLPSFRVSNARARRLLGWAPRHPSWREGVAGERWLRGPREPPAG